LTATWSSFYASRGEWLITQPGSYATSASLDSFRPHTLKAPFQPFVWSPSPIFHLGHEGAGLRRARLCAFPTVDPYFLAGETGPAMIAGRYHNVLKLGS
jgi:hypothetical protein